MKSVGWALIQYEQCPYRRRSLGHRLTQREDHVESQGEDGHLEAKERDLQKTPTLLTAWAWTFSFQKCKEVNFCCLSPPVCGILLWQP